jgi:hypothetical protein
MIKTIATTMRTSLPKANYGETLDVLAGVVVPLLAKGIIIRRPKVVALAERLDLNKRAVRRIQRLRNKYGTGPLLLRTPPWWPYALILSPDHVHRVLNNSPEPFATASREKRAASSHFQPKGVLISHGSERADRRRFNEQVLDTHRQMHHLAERFVAVADEEAAHLLTKVRDHGGQLTWDQFAGAWFPMVRRVMLGDTARDDHELTYLIQSFALRRQLGLLAAKANKGVGPVLRAAEHVSHPCRARQFGGRHGDHAHHQLFRAGSASAPMVVRIRSGRHGHISHLSSASFAPPPRCAGAGRDQEPQRCAARPAVPARLRA